MKTERILRTVSTAFLLFLSTFLFAQEGIQNPTVPPVPFDSAVDTKIYGEVKRTDGEKGTVFYLKSKPIVTPERILAEGSKFLLLNEWLTSRRSFQKVLVKVLSNPPSDSYVGDTGWVELSHTSLYPYYDNDLNKVDSNFVYKKYFNAAKKYRELADSTCRANKKCYLEYAEYFDCLAKSERDHTPPSGCKASNCAIVECPEEKKKE
jgi:hypothetical protein